MQNRIGSHWQWFFKKSHRNSSIPMLSRIAQAWPASIPRISVSFRKHGPHSGQWSIHSGYLASPGCVRRFSSIIITFVSLSRVTVRSALYLRRLYRFYFTSAVFYVTLSLFMSLSVRLGHVISISGSIRTLCTIGLASLTISHRSPSFL